MDNRISYDDCTTALMELGEIAENLVGLIMSGLVSDGLLEALQRCIREMRILSGRAFPAES